ncbi:serine/threonine-protein phosphatase 7 long form homolog [Arachis hypogaea]|uniref:serine/threonine-protein phosphatase 7 long form homolog n=1 Tax=Arachis hypogaea TaxID=3818 RepID=UPI000DED35E6|nr:serine/threonine-protein phosphatase 7 long form homolog [Arachis hypogaea]
MHASDTTQGRGAAGVAEFQGSFTSGGRAAGAGMQGTGSPPYRNLLVRKLDPPQSWNPRVENYLRATGFYHVSRIGMIRGFHPLLAALVERWRPETHTFVLPVCEVTVTLEDVAHIFGLPIDGEPVSGWTDSSSDFVQSQSMAIFGRQPVLSRNSKSYIKLGWVRSIRDEEPLDTEESIMRYVRCQIFCLLGSTLFTDKSTAYAHAKYLPLLRDFDRIHTYSWGSACLAHLYRALCRASRYDTKEMDGPLNLLFVWAWERMPCIAPVPRHILPPAEIPVAMRWSHSERSAAWLEKTIETFRHNIDYMQEFEWRPYEGMIVPGELHVHLDVCDIVAPLLSFECIEWHPANRVMRQFGFAQPPPPPPANTKGHSTGAALHGSSRSAAS